MIRRVPQKRVDQRRGASDRRTIKRFAGGGLLLASVFVLTGGCGQAVPPSPAASADLSAATELERSISVRAANGLRADRVWVAEVLANPNAIVRWTIRVTPDEAREIDEREIAKAIELRRSIGMLADESWVRSLQANPDALERNGIRMSAEEAAAFDDRIRSQLGVGPAVQAYGEQHPDEWAGAWIDPVTSAVVAGFTGHVEEHRQQILALFAPGVAAIDVRQVRWSSRELESFNAQLWTPSSLDWFDRRGIKVLGGGARVIHNDVAIKVAVPEADADLATEIVQRFNGEQWLTVEVKVDPSMDLGFGALEITVVNATGRPVAGVVCEIIPDVAGAGGDETVRDSDASGVCSWERIHATGYRVDIWGQFRQDLLVSARVRVPVEETERSTVSIKAP